MGLGLGLGWTGRGSSKWRGQPTPSAMLWRCSSSDSVGLLLLVVVRLGLVVVVVGGCGKGLCRRWHFPFTTPVPHVAPTAAAPASPTPAALQGRRPPTVTLALQRLCTMVRALPLVGHGRRARGVGRGCCNGGGRLIKDLGGGVCPRPCL